jgi:hypothetical protein
MEGNTKTKLSARTRPVRNATVIRFLEPPTYRDNDVELSVALPIQLFKIKQYSGELSAKVSLTTHKTSQCHVVV